MTGHGYRTLARKLVALIVRELRADPAKSSRSTRMRRAVDVTARVLKTCALTREEG